MSDERRGMWARFVCWLLHKRIGRYSHTTYYGADYWICYGCGGDWKAGPR